MKTRLIEDIRTYVDYPGEKHPIDYFANFLKEMGFANKQIGTDNKAGAAVMWGYKGSPITKKLSGTRFVDMSGLVPSMRLMKSSEEIALMRESAKWANLAMALLQEHSHEGLWDVDIALDASRETSVIMKKTLGPDYEPKRNMVPVSAVFRGQIDEMSAIPHSMATKRMIRKGGVIIAEVGVDIGGYSCELERTMVVGKPTEKQKKYFNIMVKAQRAAFEAIKPCVKCCEIDEAAIKVFKKAGLMNLVRHHTGHGLGIEEHEPPWLDVGNNELLHAGMIVSCEPGIYDVGFAGFRHSDTVLITEGGFELLSYYPRDLDELTIS